jgi:predicted transcriptional regulator
VAEFQWPVWMVAPDVLPELKQEGPPSKEDKKQVNMDLCLDLIRRDGETTVKELAEETGIAEGTVRSYCKSMQEDGLLEIQKRPYKPSIIRDASGDSSTQAEEWQPE